MERRALGIVFSVFLSSPVVADTTMPSLDLHRAYGLVGFSRAFTSTQDSNGGVSDMQSPDEHGWAAVGGLVWDSDFTRYANPYLDIAYLHQDDRYLALVGAGLRHDWEAEDTNWVPFVSLGAGYLDLRWREDPLDTAKAEAKNGRSFVVTAQAGTQWQFSRHWGLDLRARYDMYDVGSTLVAQNSVTQLEDRGSLSLLVGLAYRWGEAPVAASCPNTPALVPVDETGCPRRYFSVNLEFEFARFKLASLLNRPDFDVVRFLQQHPHYHLWITGHTDNRGSTAFNQTLSEKRASEARDYLVQHGIDTERIRTQGRGATMPVADNRTDAGRQKNRRIVVEFYIPDSEDGK